MERKKTFIIGDIHGCLDMLKRLLDKIPWRPGQDALIFIGDFIDRGTNSKGVVDCILDLIRNYSHVSCLLGNHEAMLLNYLSGREQDLYIANKGLTTLKNLFSRKAGRGGASGSARPHLFLPFPKAIYGASGILCGSCRFQARRRFRTTDARRHDLDSGAVPFVGL